MSDPIQVKIKSHSRDQESSSSGPLSHEAAQQVLHDLTVHRMELEMQNAELRRTQLQLLASRGRYFDLYNRAPVGYFTLTQAGLIQRANLTVAELLGVSRADLVKQPLTKFILPADQDIYYHHRKQLLETGERQVCELRLVKSNGEPYWVRLEATSAKVNSGGSVCRAVVSDITARRHTEETLRASEERHRILFEKSHDALMTLALPGWHFTSGNSTTISMFGASSEADFLSRPPSEYSPKWQLDGSASDERAAAMIEVALREGSHFYEWTYQRLSGQEFPATVLLTRIEIDSQPLLQATVRDETDVKRLQAMLRQSDRLASMGTLAAGVAHEINNPLTYVLNNIESLTEELPKLSEAAGRLRAVRDEVGDEVFDRVVGAGTEMLQPAVLDDLGERARDALDGARRIQTISRAIGTFSRVESTKRLRIDLNYAIECAATMAMTAIKFRAKLALDFAPLPRIWASEGKLSQVFLNLLINAAHAIDEGDVQHNRIQVRTWAVGEDVFAEVADTGKGISEDNLARIFEPFFTTKDVGVGSGLGLPICRNIIGDFGGDIRVESELGRGTRFTVRLPIQVGASQLPPPPSSVVAKAAVAKAVLPRAAVARPVVIKEVSSVSGHILIVDDEPAILSMLEKLLGAEHALVTAASGEAARGIIERDQSFDVILCDLMMTKMTGMDLHAWLAKQHPTLAARVVFATGGAFTRQASEYLARVDNLQVEKPYECSRIQRLIRELVAGVHNKSSRAYATDSAR